MTTITVDEVLKGWPDKDYDEYDFERINKRFPIPAVRRAEGPVDIEDLGIGDRVANLGTHIKTACRGKTKYGRPYMIIDMSDETDRLQGVMWEKDDSYLDRLQDKIGRGSEAIVHGYIQEYPLYSGKRQMVLSSIQFDGVIPVTTESRKTGIAETVMQCILALETLPEPYSTLALQGLEQHWDRVVEAVDPESMRHKFGGGIITHLRSLLKVLTYLYVKSPNPVWSMLEIVRSIQPNAVAAGGEDMVIRIPGSIDHMYRTIAKTQEALKRPGDELCPYPSFVAGVYVEIGKLVTDKRFGATTYGAESLMEVADDIGVPYKVVAPILDLIVAKPVLVGSGDTSRPSNAWVLNFSQYMADQIG